MFQSTRPARGATRRQNLARAPAVVSIHAPRAGRDKDEWAAITLEQMFQSTRPARGATMRDDGRGIRVGVSIHAPRAGRDET